MTISNLGTSDLAEAPSRDVCVTPIRNGASGSANHPGPSWGDPTQPEGARSMMTK